MLNGEVIPDGWRDDEVMRGARPLPRVQGLHERLPGHVDMPTYKAEFLSHHYAGHGRGRATRTRSG